MNVLDLYSQRGLVAVKAGNEHHGPCPGCGGEDRFCIFPEQNGGDGSWWCRQCGLGGDNIQFLIQFESKSYPEAAQAVGRELADLPPRSMSDVRRKPLRRSFDPTDNLPPDEKWQARADKFVGECCEALLADDEKLSWLKDKRGITAETVRRHRLGWHAGENEKLHATFRPRETWGLPTEFKENDRKKMLWIPAGLVIPRMDGATVTSLRIRRPAALLREQDKTRYYVVPGSSSRQLLLGKNRRAYVVVESELDGYLLSQDLNDIGVGVLALGSSATKPDANAWPHIRRAVCVLNALDFDKAGAGASSWWAENLRRSRRWPVPAAKDPGDAHQAGVDLVAWAVAGLGPLWRVGVSLGQAVEGGKGRMENKSPKSETKQPDSVQKGSKTVEKPAKAYPDSVLRLGEIIESSPVGVERTEETTRVVKNEIWEKANRAVAREFSNLVMLDPACQAFINEHPESQITGKNFWEVKGEA